jgi:hypothetical protein
MANDTRPEKKGLWMPGFAIHATRGVLRHRGMRRRAMLGTLAVALVMLVAGATFLHDSLNHHEHPAWFILFWLVCAWLTVCALLLALFDVLMIRAEGRAARNVLREQFSQRK